MRTTPGCSGASSSLRPVYELKICIGVILAAFAKIGRTSPRTPRNNMRSARLLIASLLLVAGLAAYAQDTSKEARNPRVQVETSMGKFVIELDPARAPLTVANFLQYVRDGFYSGVIFHRVINNFIAAAGP